MTTNELEANKQNAIAFYHTAYLGELAKAIELYVGDEYIRCEACVIIPV